MTTSNADIIKDIGDRSNQMILIKTKKGTVLSVTVRSNEDVKGAHHPKYKLLVP